MAGIVIELQKELLDDNTKLSSSLNKAYVIARKLNIPDLLTFLDHEINGYPNIASLPKYRISGGVLKGFNPYQGWQALVIADKKLSKTMGAVNLTMPISEIEALEKSDSDHLRMSLSPSLIPQLISEGFCTQLAVFFSSAVLSGVLNTVKTALLEWTLKLEENGIVGENLTFTDKEKATAQNTPQIINITMGQDGKLTLLGTDNSTTIKKS